MTRKQRIKPSARCIRCGHKVEAEDWADVHAQYTRHVVKEHGKPAHVRQIGRAPSPVNVDE